MPQSYCKHYYLQNFVALLIVIYVLSYHTKELILVDDAHSHLLCLGYLGNILYPGFHFLYATHVNVCLGLRVQK